MPDRGFVTACPAVFEPNPDTEGNEGIVCIDPWRISLHPRDIALLREYLAKGVQAEGGK